MSAVLLICGLVALSSAALAYVLAQLGDSALRRYRARFTERANLELRNLFLFVDPIKVYAANLVLVVLGASVVWLLTRSGFLSLLIGALLLSVPTLAWRWLRMRRLQKLESQLPDALLTLSGAMKAGVSFSIAVQGLVEQSQPPLSQEFELMLREQRLGVTLEESLNHLARRVPTQTMVLVVAAIRIASETGGGLAETLERTSTTLRSKFQLEGKIRALTAQGKVQAVVVIALPFLLLLVLSRLEPVEMAKLWTTHIGWAVCATVLVMQLLGAHFIRKIIAIDV